MVLFGMIDGEIHAYDAAGSFMHKLRMVCIENVELETALNSELFLIINLFLLFLSKEMNSNR